MAHADAQLSELATQMKSTIQEHFVPTLEGMKHKFDTAMHDMTSWADDIQDALDEIHERLPKQAREVAQTWQHQATEIKDVFGQALEGGQAYKDEVHQAEGSVHTLHETTNGHGTELHGGLETAKEIGHKVGEEVSHHLTDWMGGIEHTLAQADEHASTIEQHVTHLGGEMAHGLADVVSHIGHAAASVTEHVSKSLDEFGNDLEQMHGDQHEHMLNQVGEAIGGNVGGVISVVGEFMHAGEEMHQLFDGNLGHILDSVKEVDKVIKEIKPVIDLAETLL
jgi:methyl-accepting chemotaxis protein